MKRGRPSTSPKIGSLIKKMAVNNRTWRAPRIQGERLKLGIRINKATVRKYMYRAQNGLPPLNRQQTWASAFFQICDVFFSVLFVYFIIEQGSRQVVHFGVTRRPHDDWVAQQLHDTTSDHHTPRSLIRDNDRKYGHSFM